MEELSIKEMIDAGSHFGHQTKKWNPKMKPFLYGARSGIHIIDLQQTYGLANNAFKAVESIVAKGRLVLFVGTKPQAQSVIEAQAKRCSMPYVTRRWLGGLLTNFSTIRKSVERLIDLETRREKKDFAGFTKKELLGVDREIAKALIAIGGIKEMRNLPGAIFVVDPSIEKIAVHEANLLGIPVIAVTDSNCNPDPIDYVIPANDDALRSIEIFATRLADACLQGKIRRQEEAKRDEALEKPKKQGARKTQMIEGVGKAYVAKTEVSDTDDIEGFSSATVTPSEELTFSQSEGDAVPKNESAAKED